MNVFLIGFKNSGKSTVGPLLARLMGWSFVDLDRELEKVQDMSCREIFRLQGEPRFRELESEALKRACGAKRQVVATGGGIVKSPENCQLMQRHGMVVYLSIDWEKLWPRFAGNAPPAYVDKPQAREQLQSLFEERKPLYEKAAMLTVDASNLTPPLLAQTIHAEQVING